MDMLFQVVDQEKALKPKPVIKQVVVPIKVEKPPKQPKPKLVKPQPEPKAKSVVKRKTAAEKKRSLQQYRLANRARINKASRELWIICEFPTGLPHWHFWSRFVGLWSSVIMEFVFVRGAQIARPMIWLALLKQLDGAIE